MKISKTDCRIVNEMSSSAKVVHVRRQHHVHATDPDMHRMIAFLESTEGKCLVIKAVCVKWAPSCHVTHTHTHTHTHGDTHGDTHTLNT